MENFLKSAKKLESIFQLKTMYLYKLNKEKLRKTTIFAKFF